MGKTRLEAFSDGVIAVIITVLVLEMKVPHGPDLAALAPVLPVTRIFVKYERRLAFYDYAGWRSAGLLDAWRKRPPGVWSYRELLPLPEADEPVTEVVPPPGTRVRISVPGAARNVSAP